MRNMRGVKLFKSSMPASSRALLFLFVFFILPSFLSLSILHPSPQKKEGLSLKQSSIGSAKDPKEICFYEKERRLVVLTLDNESKKPLLGHFAKSVARLIANRLRALGYVSIKRKRHLLCASPEGAKNGERHKRYYSREGSFSYGKGSAFSIEKPHESQRNRAQLIVEYKDKVLPFQEKRNNEKAFIKMAQELQTEYLLAGRLLRLKTPGPKGETLAYKFRFFDAIYNRSYDFSMKLRQEKPYAKVDEVLEKTQKILWGKKALLVSFESPKPGAMIYLDNIYLGQTPLSRKLLGGEYELLAAQEGRQSIRKKIDIQAHKERRFHIQNSLQKGKGLLAVRSNPPGAEVYLNLRYLGKTPLRREGLPTGAHRLRLHKEGYIDSYLGVQLKSNKLESLDLNMKVGDTLTYMKEWQQVLGSLTYFDLTLYSFLASTAFYAGYLYFTAQGENAEDREQSSGNGDHSSSEKNYQYARTSANLGILSLLGTAYFLYQALSIPPPNIGEISSFLPDSERAQGSVRKQRRIPFSGKGRSWDWGVSVKQSGGEESYKAEIRSYF